MNTGATVGIATGSLTFTCARDNHKTQHSYPRAAFAHTFVSATNNAINGSKKPSKDR